MPPSVPCAGVVGGVFPDPPGLLIEGPADPPPPEPPLCAAGLAEPSYLPPPPPADVIVEKIQFEPAFPILLAGLHCCAPPPPTVTGYVVALIGKAEAANGLAVYVPGVYPSL